MYGTETSIIISLKIPGMDRKLIQDAATEALRTYGTRPKIPSFGPHPYKAQNYYF
jgi:hypothetical protein